MAGSRGAGNILDLTNASTIKDGDALRNINCYEYLKYIAARIPDKFHDYNQRFNVLIQLKHLFSTHDAYDPTIAYGDIYTNFLIELETAIQMQLDLKSNDAKNAIFFISEVIRRIYENDNCALERSANMVVSTLTNTDHKSSPKKREQLVTARMLGDSHYGFISNIANYYTGYRDVNKLTPQQAGSITGRISTFVSSDFDTLSSTSIPSIVKYSYQTETMPVQLRFGSVGQYRQNVARVNPLFRAWRVVKNRRPAPASEITPASSSSLSSTVLTAAAAAAAASLTTPDLAPISVVHQGEAEVIPRLKSGHVYFNDLGLDRTSIEGKVERTLTMELHKLEDDNDPYIAVITLPSDKGLMDKKLRDHHSKTIVSSNAMSLLSKLATGASIKVNELDPSLARALGLPSKLVRDFNLSLKTKKRLYGVDNGHYNARNESARINALLLNSLTKLGFDKVSHLSLAQVQAIYFHFVKFELTSYILEELYPETFNISCKDAIDRGGVHSAYYNLVKSIESSKPMSEDEFLRAVYAAPALVKGRGMNHHVNALWNAIDAYVDANDSNLNASDKTKWIKVWRDNNIPPRSQKYLINALNDYINTRGNEDAFHSSFGAIDKDTKINAANSVNLLISGTDIVKPFTHDQWTALHQGRLGDIIKEMEACGMVDLTRHNPQLSAASAAGPLTPRLRQ